MPNPPDKVEIVQSFLNEIESGWIIKKPTNPSNTEPDCRFYHPGKNQEVEVLIPEKLFLYNERSEIKRLVRAAVACAKAIG